MRHVCRAVHGPLPHGRSGHEARSSRRPGGDPLRGTLLHPAQGGSHDGPRRPVRRSDRPGHHLQPLHRLHPRRRHRRGRPARAPPDPPQARLGGARRRRDLGQGAGRGRRGHRQGRSAGRADQRARRHQPARHDRAVGPGHREARAQRGRPAGHPDRRAVRRTRRSAGAGPLPRADGTAPGELLLRPQGRLAARPGPGACGRAPSGGRSPSAPSTPGWCGTSPGARTAAATSST